MTKKIDLLLNKYILNADIYHEIILFVKESGCMIK